ncbi:MAG: anaerobic ribonucleoside-triphosphate reductase activating protein [Candidatus Pacebacteria bacterium]|nr:anaerobic ribonucleoside-triphosphate reductase activating protein [Candidatus Paceibacterota bacterium]
MPNQLSPIFGYLKNPSMVDYPGYLAAVMFTTGCNFRCGFCHNAGLMGSPKQGLTWDKLVDACRSFKKQWVNAVVVTGGEPTLWHKDLPRLFELFRDFNFAIKLDTNGSNPQVLETLLPGVDYVAMDVKCSLEKYPEFVGFQSPENVGHSVNLIKNSSVDHEFRTTIIEGFHTDEQMKQICRVIKGARRYALQPFLPREDLLDESLRTAPRTSPDRLKELQSMMNHCAEEVIARGS